MTTQQIGNKLLHAIVSAWPSLLTILGFAVALYLQIQILDYRMTVAEKSLAEVKTSIKEELSVLNTSVKDLQLDVRALVTLQKRSVNPDSK